MIFLDLFISLFCAIMAGYHFAHEDFGWAGAMIVFALLNQAILVYRVRFLENLLEQAKALIEQVLSSQKGGGR